MNHLLLRLFTLLVGSLWLLIAASHQAGAFPTRPIYWVVPYSPGGGVDVVTRALAREMTKELGVRVIVQNVPGGGARIGTSRVFRAAPDGHTLGTFVVGALTIAQILFDDAPYDVRQMVWIGSPYKSDYGVWVAADSPVRSLDDLRGKGRPVWIAEMDITIPRVIPAVLIMRTLNIDYKYVTGFGGTSLMNAALVRGEADLLVASVGSQVPWMKDTRNIATLAPDRHPLTPEVPTVEEQLGPSAREILPFGVANYVVGASPGTPPEAVRVLEEALLKAIESRSFRNWADRAGLSHDLFKAGSADTGKIMQEYIAGLTKQAEFLKAVMKR